MNKKFKLFIPVLFSLFIVFLFYIKRYAALKFYPPACNFAFFLIFFISLFSKETIIQKTARLMDGYLTEPVKNYTRRLTYIWCIFTFLNFLISLFTVFLPDKIWILYNGFISYMLTGSLFVIEYIIRIILRKRKLL